MFVVHLYGVFCIIESSTLVDNLLNKIASTEAGTTNNIGGFYAEDNYLIHRKEIEKWLCNQLISKGGNPQNTVPIYKALWNVLFWSDL